MIQLIKLHSMYKDRPFNLKVTYGPSTGVRFYLNICEVCEMSFSSEAELDDFIQALWEHNVERSLIKIQEKMRPDFSNITPENIINGN